jgi:hypothetical protein
MVSTLTDLAHIYGYVKLVATTGGKVLEKMETLKMTSLTEFRQCTEEEEVKVCQRSNGSNSACSTQLVSAPLDQEVLQLLESSVLNNGIDDQHQGRSDSSPESTSNLKNKISARIQMQEK